ncbi:MAG TPA: response regulator transcription factor, partial [Gaiellales bacterium]|nr:response regulator transcription factor [Gaiellales bacterium]
MRVIVADDSMLLREGVVRVLEDAGFDVVGQAGNGEELMRQVRLHQPDVAIIDIRMPPTYTDEGLRAALAIRAEIPGTAVLVLSQYLEDQ